MLPRPLPAPGPASALLLALALGAAPLLGPLAAADGQPAWIWTERVTSPQARNDQGWAVSASPDGTRVYAAGYVDNGTRDVLTIAYRASDGQVLWSTYHTTPHDDEAYLVRASPDGQRVFVTGPRGLDVLADFLTIAYDAATGAELWNATYDAAATPNPGRDVPHAMVVSPDGATVYVTGNSDGGFGKSADFATVAYNAATGAQRWVARNNSGFNAYDNPLESALSPDGTRLFVTGPSQDGGGLRDYWTIAYEVSPSGSTALWDRREGADTTWDESSAIGVTPDGSAVFVSGKLGRTDVPPGGADFGTVRYNATTGAREALVNWPATGQGESYAESLVFDPDGSRVFVTGHSSMPADPEVVNYATVAYATAPANATLAHAWNRTYDFDDRDDHALLAAFLPGAGAGAGHVVVAGTSEGAQTNQDYAVVVYEASTGAQAGSAARYDHAAVRGLENLFGLAVAPDGAAWRIFVTGGSQGNGTAQDWATVGYRFP